MFGRSVSPLQMAGIVLTGIHILVLTPVLLYWIFKVQDVASILLEIKHKSKNLTICITYFSLFGLTILRPLMIACETWALHEYLHYAWVLQAMDAIHIGLLFAMNTMNFWLLFYNKTMHIHIAELAWQRNVNPRYKS